MRPTSTEVCTIGRRAFVATLLFGPFGAVAQVARQYRVGYLSSESEAYEAKRLETLRAGLRELSYVEGRNLSIDGRFAQGDYSRLPRLASELVASRVDVIVTSGSKAGVAATRASRTIPIVVSNMGDAVNSGVVAGYSQPGGNVTGMSMMNPEMLAKQIEILKQLKPGMKTVALLLNPANPNARMIEEVARRHARIASAALEAFEVKGPRDFDAAFRRMKERRIEDLVLSSDTMFAAYEAQLVEHIRMHRIASIGSIAHASGGGLAGYSADRIEAFRQLPAIIDKLLKGAKPSQIPVEQPSKIVFVINMRTAKELGVAVPPTLLLVADKVIE